MELDFCFRNGYWRSLAAGAAGETLRKSRRWSQVQRYVSGTIFVGLGLVTALTGSHAKSA